MKHVLKDFTVILTMHVWHALVPRQIRTLPEAVMFLSQAWLATVKKVTLVPFAINAPKDFLAIQEIKTDFVKVATATLRALFQTNVMNSQDSVTASMESLEDVVTDVNFLDIC